jgi:hypothetical protein
VFIKETVGISELRRKKCSKFVKNRQGENIAQHSGSVMKWHDKRNVTITSTYHTDETKSVANRRREKIRLLSIGLPETYGHC